MGMEVGAIIKEKAQIKMGSLVLQWQPGMVGGRGIVAKSDKSLLSKTAPSYVVVNHHNSTCNVTYRSSDEVRLPPSPALAVGVSFDQYMEDKGRIIRAVIPEKASVQQLNQEEWRIKMPASQILFLTVHPVVYITVTTKSNGKDYPSHIPLHITKLFEAHATKLELQGVPADYVPALFQLEATGILYPRTRGLHSSINNQLNTNLSVVFPTLLSWVPQHVLRNLLHSIVKQVVEDIKKGFTVRLLADYRSFQRSNAKKSVL